MVEKYFRLVQVGFGTKGGCKKAIIYSVLTLESIRSKFLAKIDVKNSSNSIEKDVH